MNRRCFMPLAAGLALVAGGAPGADTALPDSLAGFRLWRKLTPEPQLVPYQLSFLCATLPPTLENLKRHGPHTNHWIMVYANPSAAEGLKDESARQFPPGAIIAKEKRDHRRVDASDGIAFMVKHPVGEFDVSGGWEFLYYPATETKGTKASYDNCISCHKAGATKDYVFGTYGARASR